MPRSSEFTQDWAERICDRVAEGANLDKLCELDDFPSKQTVFKWLRQNTSFADEYARARSLRSDARSDRIDAICARVEAGDLDANAARVIIDAEKWQAGKENPKRYGDKVSNEVTGAGGGPVTINIVPVKPATSE